MLLFTLAAVAARCLWAWEKDAVPKDEAPQETRDPQKNALLAPQTAPCFLVTFFIWKPSRNVNLSERIAHDAQPPVISTVKGARVCSFWYFYNNLRLH